MKRGVAPETLPELAPESLKRDFVPRYEHLELLQLPEQLERRKHGGGSPPPPRDRAERTQEIAGGTRRRYRSAASASQA